MSDRITKQTFASTLEPRLFARIMSLFPVLVDKDDNVPSFVVQAVNKEAADLEEMIDACREELYKNIPELSDNSWHMVDHLIEQMDDEEKKGIIREQLADFAENKRYDLMFEVVAELGKPSPILDQLNAIANRYAARYEFDKDVLQKLESCLLALTYYPIFVGNDENGIANFSAFKRNGGFTWEVAKDLTLLEAILRTEKDFEELEQSEALEFSGDKGVLAAIGVIFSSNAHLKMQSYLLLSGILELAAELQEQMAIQEKLGAEPPLLG